MSDMIIKVFEYRIVKIEKGAFFIKYKSFMCSSWKELDKQFRTKPRAEAWARKNIIIKGDK